VIKGILAGIAVVFFLTGCSSFEPVKPIVIEKRVEPIRVFHPPLPDPVRLNDFEWKVLTIERMKQLVKDYDEGKAPRVVYYAITPDGYEVLAENVALLKRYIKEQKAIIIYYRENLVEIYLPEAPAKPSKSEATKAEEPAPPARAPVPAPIGR
jgi:hypothetical protein